MTRHGPHIRSGLRTLGVWAAVWFAPGSAPSQAQTAVVVVAGLDAEQAPAKALLQDTVEAAGARPGLKLLPQARANFLFSAKPTPDRSAARARAQALLKRAQEHLQGFQVAEAKDALAEATKLLKPDLGIEGARPFNQLKLALAVAVAHAQRDQSTLASALAQYAARFGTASPEPGLWPPELKRRLDTLVARAQTKLHIICTPPGEAFVDGLKVGMTPLTVDKLPPGRHRIEVRAAEHLPAFAWATTKTTRLARAELELAPAVAHRLAVLPAQGDLPQDLRTALMQATLRGPAELLILVAPAAEDRVSVRILDTVGSGRVHGPTLADTAQAALDLAWGAWAESKVRAPTAGLRPWAYGAAGLGVAAASVGVGLRLWAKDTQAPLQSQRGALTQSSAYAIQDRAEQRALMGTVLLATGAALVTGAAGLFTWDLLSSEPQ